MPRYSVKNNKNSAKQELLRKNKTDYDGSKKKQENSSNQEENQEIVCQSISEAEDKLREFLNEGRRYNELTQIRFRIGDRIKRFNPTQISAIGKNSGKTPKHEKSDNIPISNPTQTIFRLLKKGKSLTNIVIKTGIDPEIVESAYKQYLEFEKNMAVPKSFIMKMLRLSRRVSPKCNDYEKIEAIMEGGINSYFKLRKFIYPCSVCRKSISIDDVELKYVQTYLSQRWGHAECIQRVNKNRINYNFSFP